MSDRSEKVKAGLFVVISVALFAVVVVLTAGLRLTRTTKTYEVRFRASVTGLEPSSTVRYNGVAVGRVSEIKFAEDDFPTVQVKIEVDPTIPLRVDTVAKLKPQGITGISYIDLAGGSLDAELLMEGAVIPSQVSITEDITEILSKANQFLGNLNDFIETNDEAVTGAVTDIREAAGLAKATMARLPDALDELTFLTRDLRTSFAKALESAQASLEAIERFVGDPEIQAIPRKVGSVLDRAERVLKVTEDTVAAADIAKVLESLERALGLLDKTATAVTDAVAQVKTGVAENRGSLLRILSDLRLFSATLRSLAEEVRDDPTRLLFSRPRPERQEGR